MDFDIDMLRALFVLTFYIMMICSNDQGWKIIYIVLIKLDPESFSFQIIICSGGETFIL